MYLFDQLSVKLNLLRDKARADTAKLSNEEWKVWRVYHVLDSWLSQVYQLTKMEEKQQLLYLFGMEFLFLAILEQWDSYFGSDVDDPNIKQRFLSAVELVDDLRQQLNVTLIGTPQLEAEYFCKKCNAFFYHRSPFLIHCFNCEGLLDFMDIIPVKQLLKGFSRDKIERFFGNLQEAVFKLNL